jgi:hypothetical protein
MEANLRTTKTAVGNIMKIIALVAVAAFLMGKGRK